MLSDFLLLCSICLANTQRQTLRVSLHYIVMRTDSAVVEQDQKRWYRCLAC